MECLACCRFRCFCREPGRGVADDGLEHEPVRSRGKAVADAEFNVDFFHLKIGDRIQFLVLQLQRQEIANLAEVGIIFEADKSIFAKIAGKPHRRRKIRFAGRAEADIDDRVDNKLALFIANPDDRPNSAATVRTASYGGMSLWSRSLCSLDRDSDARGVDGERAR